MDTIVMCIEGLQAKLEKHRKDDLKETPTRVIFTDVLLQALGWDIRNPDEVELECPTIDGKSVDYALKIDGKSVLFVEAKPLNDPLTDVKSITQVVGYAANAGVEWCILTNGVTYKVYHSTEKAEAPEKLLFEVSLDVKENKGMSVQQVAERFSRFSRDAMAKGVLDEIGRETFTMGKIRKALDKMFAEPPNAFVRLVRSTVGDDTIKPAQVKKALNRLWARTSQVETAPISTLGVLPRTTETMKPISKESGYQLARPPDDIAKVDTIVVPAWEDGFQEDSKEMYKMARPVVILGTSSNGKDISLHGCFLIQSQKSYPGFSISSYFAKTVFVGAHFHKTEDVRFRSMNVRFSHFDEWANLSGFKIDHPKEEDVVIRYKRPNDIRVSISGNFIIAITTRVKFPVFTLVQKKAGVEQQTIARIETVHESFIENFLSVTQHLQHFLCLAVREPVYVLNMEGETEANKMTDMDYYPPIGIFYKSPYISEAPESLLGWDMLFTYQDISADLEVLLGNWFEKADVLKPICGLYFGMLYNPHLYLENQFLSLVQAAEAFHERIYMGEYLPDSEYKALAFTPLVNAIPDVKQDLKESLVDRLSYGNKYSLRTRLKELLDECGRIVPQLLGNRKEFIKKVIDTRNYHTHYDQKLYKRAARGQDLVSLTKKLRILLEVCLVTQTGLDANKAIDLFGKHRRVREEAFGQFPTEY
ncbi:hypothetical protein ES707_13096 [subsurface metagenome]